MLPCLLLGCALPCCLPAAGRMLPIMESICQCCSSNLSLGMLLLPGLRQKRAWGICQSPGISSLKLCTGCGVKKRHVLIACCLVCWSKGFKSEHLMKESRKEGRQKARGTRKLQLVNVEIACAFRQEYFCSVKLLLQLFPHRGCQPQADFQPLEGLVLLLWCSREAPDAISLQQSMGQGACGTKPVGESSASLALGTFPVILHKTTFPALQRTRRRFQDEDKSDL